MGSGFSKMKKKARQMQEQMNQIKESMKTTFFEGSSGNGLVKLTLNGEKELKKIQIQPEVLTDVEALQDLILAAHQDAVQKVEQTQSASDFSFL